MLGFIIEGGCEKPISLFLASSHIHPPRSVHLSSPKSLNKDFALISTWTLHTGKESGSGVGETKLVLACDIHMANMGGSSGGIAPCCIFLVSANDMNASFSRGLSVRLRGVASVWKEETFFKGWVTLHPQCGLVLAETKQPVVWTINQGTSLFTSALHTDLFLKLCGIP